MSPLHNALQPSSPPVSSEEVVEILRALGAEDRARVLAACREQNMFTEIGDTYQFSLDPTLLEALARGDANPNPEDVEVAEEASAAAVAAAEVDSRISTTLRVI
eukprot:1179906-Prorocentrum_minimum.AAC.7